jgi:cytochrome o ubiquinol oxidase subunit 2
LRFLRHIGLFSPLLLAGCSTDAFRLFHPFGLIAGLELHYTLLITGIMMIIIVPTLLMAVLFPILFHHSRNAKYDPHWHFSAPIEIAAWGVPLVIVAVLGWLSVKSIHDVDPWNPPILATAPGASTAPLTVEVIATDWQWVFVYPDLKIVTIDDLVVPAGTRVNLKLTATSNMNGFYIPQVAPMVDAMPAMETKDAFEIDQTASFTGFSTDFSGAGFSWDQFATHVVAPADFANWVKTVQASTKTLDYAGFTQTIAQPQVNYGATPSYFSAPNAAGIFGAVIMDAENGKTYPVSTALTKSVADSEAAK